MQYKESYPIYLLFIILLPVNIIMYYGSIETGFQAHVFGLLLSLVIIILFYEFRITVDDNKINISFGIGLIKKQIYIKDIIAIKSHTIPFYTGIGIRILGNNTMQYNGKIGKAVKLTMSDSKSYVISTANPERLIALINRLKEQ